MAAEKSRYYMEKSIPELQELGRRGIFSQPEISEIIKKRSQFELAVNASGCKIADFTRYLEYEINLESLREKRVRRLGVTLNFRMSGLCRQRIFFLLDRATTKFPGSKEMWMFYLEYARKARADKMVDKALMNVLRLHPMEEKFWVFAALCAVEDRADVSEGRSYLQRGLRFRKRSRLLWVEYAKLEMVFVAKILARRELLGIGGGPGREEEEEGGGGEREESFLREDMSSEGNRSSGEEMEIEGEVKSSKAKTSEGAEEGEGEGEGEGEEDEEPQEKDMADEETNTDIIKLPEFSTEDLQPHYQTDSSISSQALEDEKANPALKGALALAIFDAAVKEIPGDVDFAREFFTLFTKFGYLRCSKMLLQHVISYARAIAFNSPTTWIMIIQAPLVGVEPTDPMFVSCLRIVLKNIQEAAEHAEPKVPLYDAFVRMMVDMAISKEIDHGVRVTAAALAIRYFQRAEDDSAVTVSLYCTILEMLRKGIVGTLNITEADVVSRGLSKFPGNADLLSIAANPRDRQD